MSDNPFLPDPPVLSPLTLDMAAAARVLNCPKFGLRAYAEAGGLDPASDFRGLNLRGWDLTGQDLRGFDLSHCDLRNTNIEHAKVDKTTYLEEVKLNEGVVPGHNLLPDLLTAVDLERLLAEGVFPPNKNTPKSNSGTPPTVHQYWGRTLLDLGRPAEALAELDTLLALEEGVKGTDNPEVLTTRHYRARALFDLGRALEAFAEFSTLLPLEEVLRGANDPSTLLTRHYRGRALLDLGRASEALAEFDALLPIEQTVRGVESIDTIHTLQHRGRALLDLGRPPEALDNFRLAETGYMNVKAGLHHWLIVNRTDQIACLVAMGMIGFSVKMRHLKEELTWRSSVGQPLDFRVRYCFARSLIADGDSQAARDAVAELLALAEQKEASNYRYVIAARRLLAVLDGTDDGKGLPY